MRICIPVETHVVITLDRLGSSNTLQMCGEVFGVAECTTFFL